jgi:translation initiation factor 2 subunit 3
MSTTVPSLNIGIIGNVAHGKTTLVKALTGKNTMEHSSEKKNNHTVNLGYANLKIFKCEQDNNLSSSLDSPSLLCNICNKEMILIKYFSLIDCPGHSAYMKAMQTGSGIMDFVILVISANDKFPQAQTIAHLRQVLSKCDNILIIQNKIDLIQKKQAIENAEEIKKYIKSEFNKEFPIIPMCAQKKININYLLEFLIKVPEKKTDTNESLKLQIIRSFNCNKPGIPIEKMVGGVIGGSIVSGKIKIGNIISINTGKQIIQTKIISIHLEKEICDEATAGGLYGFETELDPVLTKNNKLAGKIAIIQTN